jgi:hypothetical protein
MTPTPTVSLRRLLRVEVMAFDRALPRTWGARIAFAGETSLTLWAYHRRVHPSGRAVCLLGLRPGRVGVVVAAFTLSIGAMGALAPMAAGAVCACIVAVLLPSAARAIGALPARSRLRQGSRPGPHVFLHSLASTQPGAGAELVRSVTDEADQKGWTISLEAASEELAHYYECLGFQAQGVPVPVPGGGRHVSMCRPPALCAIEGGKGIISGQENAGPAREGRTCKTRRT